MRQHHSPRPRQLPTTRLRTLLATTIAVVAISAGALSLAAVPAAAAKVDPARVGLYGTADPTYDGVFRQSLAILGILAAGEQPSTAAVGWLLDQQCADGGFMAFNPTPDRPCVAPDPLAFSGEDTNSTALAVQALVALGKSAEADEAVAFLQDARADDGGWPYIPGGDSDPNSTGLVLMGLSARGAAVDQDAVDHLAAGQVGCSGDPADQGGFTTAWSGGAPDVLATVQAVPGLAGLHLDALDAPDPWATDTPEYPCPVDITDAATVAGWGAAWLATQAAGGAVTGNNRYWAALAFAATSTGQDSAQTLYASALDDLGAAPKPKDTTPDVRPLAQSAEDPGTLGLAALVGVTQGGDVSALAVRIGATETVAAKPTPSPSADDSDPGDAEDDGVAAGEDTLPDTGSDPALVTAGIVLLLAGLGLLVLTRRRPTG